MPWIFPSEALEMVIVKPWVPRATLMGWEMPMCAPRSAVRVSLTAHGVFCDLGWWVWGTASLFSAGCSPQTCCSALGDSAAGREGVTARQSAS